MKGFFKQPTGEQICNVIGLPLIGYYSCWQVALGVFFIIMGIHFARNRKTK